MIPPPDLRSIFKPLSAFDRERPTWLIDRFLINGFINSVYADGGKGKSYLALYIAHCVAAGKQFLGRNVVQGNVLYVDFELTGGLQGYRQDEICAGLGIRKEDVAESLFYFAPDLEGGDGVPANFFDLLPYIQRLPWLKLVVIDSWGVAVAGDAISSADMIPWLQQVRFIGDGTILLLDHQSKQQRGDKSREKTIFGSVYKTNIARNVWHLNSTAADPNKLLLKHTKANISAIQDSIGLEVVINEGSSYEVKSYTAGMEFADHVSIWEEIIMVLGDLGQATAKKIAEETHESLDSVRTTLTSLQKNRRIEVIDKKGKEKVYALPPKLSNKAVLNQPAYSEAAIPPLTSDNAKLNIKYNIKENLTLTNGVKEAILGETVNRIGDYWKDREYVKPDTELTDRLGDLQKRIDIATANIVTEQEFKQLCDQFEYLNIPR